MDNSKKPLSPSPKTTENEQDQSLTLFQKLKQSTKESLYLKMTVFCLIIFLVSVHMNNLDSLEKKLRFAVCAFNFVLFFLSLIFLPRITNKPFLIQIFFKLVQAAVFVYFINLVFLILLDRETIKYVLGVIDPKLLIPLPERDYATDCRIYTPENPDSKFANLMGAMDVFISAHFVGWLVKALIFRNSFVSWTLSIGFEIYELSFRHWLPNFYECWWDHLLLDLFGCNLLGIMVGNYIMKALKMKKFHWFWEPTAENDKQAYNKRFAHSVSNIDTYIEQKKWHFLSSPSSFLTLIFLILLTSIIDLSNFFNKSQLGIPANHFLLGFRIFPVGFYSILIVDELYHYAINNNKNKKIPFNMTLGLFVLLGEVILFIKNFKPDLYINETPLHIKTFWITVAVLCSGLLTYSAYVQKRNQIKSKQ